MILKGELSSLGPSLYNALDSYEPIGSYELSNIKNVIIVLK